MCSGCAKIYKQCRKRQAVPSNAKCGVGAGAAATGIAAGPDNGGVPPADYSCAATAAAADESDDTDDGGAVVLEPDVVHGICGAAADAAAAAVSEDAADADDEAVPATPAAAKVRRNRRHQASFSRFHARADSSRVYTCSGQRDAGLALRRRG